MRRIAFCLCGLAMVGLALAPWATAQTDGPRTPSGHPDLSGTYDVSTLTPMQRPTDLGEQLFLTEEEAAEIAQRQLTQNIERNQPSDPNRGAPPQGGDGSAGAAGKRRWLQLFLARPRRRGLPDRREVAHVHSDRPARWPLSITNRRADRSPPCRPR